MIGRPCAPELALNRKYENSENEVAEYFAATLSRNPCPDLARWIQRMYLTRQVISGKLRVEASMEYSPSVIHGGQTVFDIGANVEAYTFDFSRLVSPIGKVYAFEPFPQNYEVLLHTIRKERLKNVVPLKIAVADEVGSREMVLPGNYISALRLPGFTEANPVAVKQ